MEFRIISVTWYPDGEYTAKIEREKSDFLKVRAVHILDSPLKSDFIWPEESEILSRGGGRVWKKGREVLSIPNENRLRERIFVISHAGYMGHRGIKPTMQTIQELYFWDTMETDVKAWCEGCLCCLLGKTSVPIARPFGEMIRGEKPNEVLHLDYMYLYKAWHLVIKDDVSLYFDLHEVDDLTAESTVDKVIDWFVRYGLPKMLVTDRGYAF